MKKESICFYRGFGAGIVITVMIMFLSINYFEKDESDTMKENENVIKEEMLKKETLKEVITKPKQGENKIEQDQKQANEEIGENIAQNNEKIKEEIKKEIIEELKENEKAAVEKEKAAAELAKQTEEVIIKVEYGMSSTSVAKLLKEKGLISDIKDFNSYMKTKEKVTKIRVGTFKIKANSTYDEIIGKIVG